MFEKLAQIPNHMVKYILCLVQKPKKITDIFSIAVVLIIISMVIIIFTKFI